MTERCIILEDGWSQQNNLHVGIAKSVILNHHFYTESACISELFFNCVLFVNRNQQNPCSFKKQKL